MALLVKKFGGSSVATPEKMRHIASRVLKERNPDDQIVIVVSAMGDTTDNLLNLASKVTDKHYARELDMLMSTGEQVSIAMMAMTFCSMGVPAQSFTGPQAGIIAEGVFGKGNIIDIKPARVFKALAAGKIAIVAGFQAITPEGEIITLGRGGSDTTAVALAGAVKADMCEIYTDVEGVYSADPRVVPNAVKMKEISNEEMLELARLGAGVMQPQSISMGSRFHVPIHVRSTFSDNEGTIIREDNFGEEKGPVCGVAEDYYVARIAAVGVENVPGTAAMIFNELDKNEIPVDMIVQSVRRINDRRGDIIFTVASTDLVEAKEVLEKLKVDGRINNILYDDNCAKVSIVGLEMLSAPGVEARIFGALGRKNINIDIVSSSKNSISCLVPRSKVDEAIRSIHAEFFKNKPQQ